MARSVVALYIMGFFFILLSFFTGIAGKWAVLSIGVNMFADNYE